MMILYRKKPKGSLKQMNKKELQNCMDYFGIDKSKIKGTGQKGKLLKTDMINYLNTILPSKNMFHLKLASICLGTYRTSMKLFMYSNNFNFSSFLKAKEDNNYETYTVDDDGSIRDGFYYDKKTMDFIEARYCI